MEVIKFSQMEKGWFIGDFLPTAFKTKDFEVSYKIHPAGEIWDTHYHKVATEINLLIKGEMKICGKELTSGDIFIIYPMEISEPKFYTDCEIICVKTPSVKSDKFIVNE